MMWQKGGSAMAQHIHECICECQRCGHEFSFTNVDIARNKSGRWKDLSSDMSMLTGSRIERSIALNHQKTSYQQDFSRCPKCGSRKIYKEYDDYWVDEYGEYLDDYEPTIGDRASEEVSGIGAGIGNFMFRGCLLVTMIPFLIMAGCVLMAIYTILKIIF